MKPFIGLSFVLAFSFLTLSCSDRGVDGPADTSPQGSRGNIALTFSTPPPEVARVVARISRPGFATRTLEMTISDSMQSASGSFTDVASGVWHLAVEALNIGGTVLYAGEAEVEVRPGQIALVTLQLHPASGGINILVTWGTLPQGFGLMAYYPFNGDANDASGNGNNGEVTGATPTADRYGTPNSAYWFDGINDMVSIPSSQTLHPLNRLTITFWIRVDSVMNNYMPILHKGGPVIRYFENREYSIYLKANYSHPFFQVLVAGDGSGQHFIPSSGHEIHQWLFFTTVIDRQVHRMQVYINGELDNTAPDSYSSFNPNDYPFTIGAEAETWPDHSPFRGAIDELRLYNRALTAMEIQALFSTQ